MKNLYLVMFCVLLVLTVTAHLSAAPQAELWDAWTPYAPESQQQIDHAAWDAFLVQYLDTEHPSGVNWIAYSDVTAADRQMLQGYLSQLGSVEVDELSRNEQMAYWLNLYNALTVEVMLEHWPVDTIRDINLGGGGLFSRGPWDAELITVQDRPLTLNDIEHRILRPIWNDPRIHYAVNCASYGCPDLQPTAFTAENLEQLLEKGAKGYINSPRGVEIDGRTLRLSSIYDWFSEDFGDSRESILQHVMGYADQQLAGRLQDFADGSGRIRYRYDWSVNGE